MPKYCGRTARTELAPLESRVAIFCISSASIRKKSPPVEESDITVGLIFDATDTVVEFFRAS